MNTSPKSGKTAEKADADKPEDAAEALAAEVAALRAELRSLVEHVGAVGASARGGAKRAARALAAEGADRGARAADDLMDEWRELDRRVLAETRDNPWRSLGIAALAGLVLGLILRR